MNSGPYGRENPAGFEWEVDTYTMSPVEMSTIHSLIVGGTRGAGKVIAERLLAKGHDVSIVSRTKPQDPLAATYIQLDLSDPKSLPERIGAALPPAVNFNHLIFAQRFRGEGDDWHGELHASVSATRAFIEAVDRRCPDGAAGTITIIGSVYGRFVGEGQPVSYHIAKAALEHLVRYYAVNLGKKGIRVNGVSPSRCLKPESREYVLEDEKLMKLLKEIVPIGRLGTTDDIADTVEFLLSPGASYVTGNIITLDGGLSLVWPETAARKIAGF